MSAPPSRFENRQYRFFAEADARHFLWQTQSPYFADTERALLQGFPVADGQAILELGCGEGGNLANLLRGTSARPRLLIGVDLFARKLSFARAQGIPARFVCGDALTLPFRDGVFDAILCRDVLHHLEHPEVALAGLRRLCKPDGSDTSPASRSRYDSRSRCTGLSSTTSSGFHASDPPAGAARSWTSSTGWPGPCGRGGYGLTSSSGPRQARPESPRPAAVRRASTVGGLGVSGGTSGRRRRRRRRRSRRSGRGGRPRGRPRRTGRR